MPLHPEPTLQRTSGPSVHPPSPRGHPVVMFDSQCVIQFSTLASALSAFLTTFLARRGTDNEDKPSFFFSYLTLGRLSISLGGTIIHIGLISKDTPSSYQNVVLLSVRVILNMMCLIYHHYWSLGAGWRNLNVSSVHWRYNTVVLATSVIAYFGGIGIWFIIFYDQGIGDVIILNVQSVFIITWTIKRGYKDAIQGRVFKYVRDTIFIASSLSFLCGGVNITELSISRAAINFSNACVGYVIGIIAHHIYKKDELPRLTRIGIDPIVTSIDAKKNLRKYASSTNR